MGESTAPSDDQETSPLLWGKVLVPQMLCYPQVYYRVRNSMPTIRNEIKAVSTPFQIYLNIIFLQENIRTLTADTSAVRWSTGTFLLAVVNTFPRV